MNIINVFDKSIIRVAHSLHNNYQVLDLFFSLITNLGEALPFNGFYYNIDIHEKRT